MKRLNFKIALMVLLFMAYVVSANAQDSSTEPKKNKLIKYQGEVAVSYGLGVGKETKDNKWFFGATQVQGIKIGKYFSTGLGMGINMYMPYSYTQENQLSMYMPFFLNSKGHLPVNSKIGLFISFDIGTTMRLTYGAGDSLMGLLTNIAVGANIIDKISIGIAYDNNMVNLHSNNKSMGALNLRVAYLF